jgi:hypothetical protein
MSAEEINLKGNNTVHQDNDGKYVLIKTFNGDKKYYTGIKYCAEYANAHMYRYYDIICFTYDSNGKITFHSYAM